MPISLGSCGCCAACGSGLNHAWNDPCLSFPGGYYDEYTLTVGGSVYATDPMSSCPSFIGPWIGTFTLRKCQDACVWVTDQLDDDDVPFWKMTGFGQSKTGIYDHSAVLGPGNTAILSGCVPGGPSGTSGGSTFFGPNIGFTGDAWSGSIFDGSSGFYICLDAVTITPVGTKIDCVNCGNSPCKPCFTACSSITVTATQQLLTSSSDPNALGGTGTATVTNTTPFEITSEVIVSGYNIDDPPFYVEFPIQFRVECNGNVWSATVVSMPAGWTQTYAYVYAVHCKCIEPVTGSGVFLPPIIIMRYCIHNPSEFPADRCGQVMFSCGGTTATTLLGGKVPGTCEAADYGIGLGIAAQKLPDAPETSHQNRRCGCSSKKRLLRHHAAK